MAIRLVVTDMDGTLLTGEKKVGPRTRAAVAAVRRAGVRFLLASARPFCSAHRYAALLDLDTPLICYNGALVRTPAGETISTRPLPRGLARELARFVREEGLYMKVYGDDEFFVEAATAETAPYAARYFVPFRAVGNMEEFIDGEGPAPFSFVVHTAPDRLHDVRASLTQQFGGRITCHCPNEHAIHISDPGASKLIALERLTAEWGISAREVMAFGDGDNDLEMIRWAGLGVAVANAWEGLRRAADAVTLGNDEDGVGVALEHYLGLPPASGAALGAL